MKKLNITFLLTMLMSMVGLNASAHDIEVKNADGVTIYYNYINGGEELEVTYRGSSYYSYSYEYTGNVVIPESVTYNEKTYSVTSIGSYAFYGCPDLTSVTIPNSVTSIGGYAFWRCSGLTSITIPNSVTSIGGYAFYDCSGLTSITIPNSVISIGGYAFQYCSGLTSITIPNSVTSIEGYAFHCSGLTSITIPNSVTSIEGYAFSGCSRLTSVTIPNSVKTIGESAFERCLRLTSVTIGNNVTSIGNSAFSSCSGLTSITIPNSVKTIGESAFSSCSGLTSVTIPNSVTTIGEWAFSYCSELTSVTIPNSVTSIGNWAFYSCSGLTSVTIPNSVTSIGGGAFYGCRGLTSITIPNSVTSIGGGAFMGCSGLTSVTIPNSVTSIETRTFYECSGLTSVIIPNSVTNIGSEAFNNNDNLKFVYALSEFPSFVTMYKQSFPVSQSSYRSTLYVKKGLKDLYSKSDGWKNFVDIREMTDEQYEELVKKTKGDDEQEETIVNLAVTLSSAGYATFYNDSRNFKLPAGVSALVLTSESGQTLNYKTIANGDANGIIPKGVPVILVSNNRKGGTYTLISTTESASYSGENLLHGSSLMTMTSNVNGISTSGNSNYVYYKLAYGKSGSVNANKLGWYWGANNGAAFTIAGGKAWLALPKSSAQSLDAILLEEDDATSIDGIEQSNMNEANDAQYNMAGQRVGNGYNGIIIVNGKKVIR